MKSNIFIPQKINVGYQKRNDTYTGKLAYIIYYDEKDKLRKETSWNNWRDKNIPNEEFDNVPTSGFVLNKKVGDYSNGWDHRHAYCRVYDPRNFEFEISIENLLYILENTSSIKGKGLEGEFVYGWDGTDLVLVPVEAADYKQIAEYNKIVHNKESIRAKDLVIGATYLTKNNTELVYMGKYECYPYGSRGDKSSYGKQFWFAYKQYDYEYMDGERVRKYTYKWALVKFKNISGGKLIKCIDENCSSEYSDIFDVMEKDCQYSPYDSSKDKFFPISLEEFLNKGKETYHGGVIFYNNITFISDVHGEKCTYYATYIISRENRYIVQKKGRGVFINETNIFPCEIAEVEHPSQLYYRKNESVKRRQMIPVTLEEIYKVMKPLYRQKYLENGKEYERVWYLE